MGSTRQIVRFMLGFSAFAALGLVVTLFVSSVSNRISARKAAKTPSVEIVKIQPSEARVDPHVDTSAVTPDKPVEVAPAPVPHYRVDVVPEVRAPDVAGDPPQPAAVEAPAPLPPLRGTIAQSGDAPPLRASPPKGRASAAKSPAPPTVEAPLPIAPAPVAAPPAIVAAPAKPLPPAPDWRSSIAWGASR